MLRYLVIAVCLALTVALAGFVMPSLYGGSPVFYFGLALVNLACMPLVLRMERRWHAWTQRRRAVAPER